MEVDVALASGEGVFVALLSVVSAAGFSAGVTVAFTVGVTVGLDVGLGVGVGVGVDVAIGTATSLSDMFLVRTYPSLFFSLRT